MSENSLFQFAAEPLPKEFLQQINEKKPVYGDPWNVVIVDDDEAIHQVTRLALNGFRFSGRPLKLLHAYSADEGAELLATTSNVAVALIDVVMESDTAGLDLVRTVREEQDNHDVRIVLRTGQPGQAPEREVIANYDINDYKEKNELTAQKLFTLMFATLRSYRDIMALNANREGLERVINSSGKILKRQSMDEFAGGVLQQLIAVTHGDKDAAFLESDGLAAIYEEQRMQIIAATGAFRRHVGSDASRVMPHDVQQDLDRALQGEDMVQVEDRVVAKFDSATGAANLLYMSGLGEISGYDQHLIELFTRNVAVAFENMRLNEDLEETQREIIHLLGESIETRSKETGNHVRRLAEISKLLALNLGVDPTEAEMLRFASPLHDLGKIGIPDAILNKPGKLTEDEWVQMKTHAELGHNLLKGSKRKILQIGSKVAHEHHEKWDGSGYPHNKAGEEIHLYGRITAVADVFDALASDRCYKEAWPMSQVLSFINDQAGYHFDPAVVSCFAENVAEIMNIRDRYQDVPA